MVRKPSFFFFLHFFFIYKVDNLLKKKNIQLSELICIFRSCTEVVNVSKCIFHIFPDGFNSTLQISSRGGICYSFPIGVHLSQT